MGNSDYDDFYEDDEEEEEQRDYTPPKPVTAEAIAGIVELKSPADVEDLMSDMYANINLAEIQARAEILAERMENLKKAHSAPRCQYIRVNGTTCRSPAVSGQSYCHFHGYPHAPSSILELPVIEDDRSFQVAMMRVSQQIAAGVIRPDQARVLLQALSMAYDNLRTNPKLGEADN